MGERDSALAQALEHDGVEPAALDQVDGQTTSSSWAPPLAIPYGLMALGMSLLSLQLLLQSAARVNGLRGRRGEPA